MPVSLMLSLALVAWLFDWLDAGAWPFRVRSCLMLAPRCRLDAGALGVGY